MSETPPEDGGETPKAARSRPHRATSKSHAEVKAERLKAALRDNLRRRKIPETGVSSPMDEGSEADGPAHHEKATDRDA